MMATARSLLKSMHVSAEFWGEAVRHTPEFRVSSKSTRGVAESTSPLTGTTMPEPATCVGYLPPAVGETNPSTLSLRILLQVSDSPYSGPVYLREITDIYADIEEVALDDDKDKLMMLEFDEPTCYREAVAESAWYQAIEKKLESIEKNNTWTLTKIPPGHTPIGLKWVFKLKKDSNGQVVKQKPANRSWEVYHMDVKSAFLNGDIEEEVYVTRPKGLEVQDKKHLVYRLSKVLYGLGQDPRAWNTRLNRSLKELGFTRCTQEQAVYTRGEGGATLIVGV
ncbi:Retrovirus-related Pol polyprotein from transposon TNT 1-94-like protein [Drosera capensis]